MRLGRELVLGDERLERNVEAVGRAGDAAVHGLARHLDEPLASRDGERARVDRGADLVALEHRLGAQGHGLVAARGVHHAVRHLGLTEAASVVGDEQALAGEGAQRKVRLGHEGAVDGELAQLEHGAREEHVDREAEGREQVEVGARRAAEVGLAAVGQIEVGVRCGRHGRRRRRRRRWRRRRRRGRRRRRRRRRRLAR